jgi:hypothetical protein
LFAIVIVNVWSGLVPVNAQVTSAHAGTAATTM